MFPFDDGIQVGVFKDARQAAEALSKVGCEYDMRTGRWVARMVTVTFPVTDVWEHRRAAGLVADLLAYQGAA